MSRLTSGGFFVPQPRPQRRSGSTLTNDTIELAGVFADQQYHVIRNPEAVILRSWESDRSGLQAWDLTTTLFNDRQR